MQYVKCSRACAENSAAGTIGVCGRLAPGLDVHCQRGPSGVRRTPREVSIRMPHILDARRVVRRQGEGYHSKMQAASYLPFKSINTSSARASKLRCSLQVDR